MLRYYKEIRCHRVSDSESRTFVFITLIALYYSSQVQMTLANDYEEGEKGTKINLVNGVGFENAS